MSENENKDIRKSRATSEIVECTNSKIYDDLPSEIIDFFHELPSTAYYDYLRTLSVPYLFRVFEQNILTDKDPRIWFKEYLILLRRNVQNLLHGSALHSLLEHIMEEQKTKEKNPEEVKTYTGNHYGSLFKEFSQKSYFEEARQLLEIRLKRNNIEIANLSRASVLDQGCGGGRYACAWKLLGAAKVVGLDFSEVGLEDAQKRTETAGIKGVSFKKGSVLDMPFENDSFDIVFSNGVLHHTEDWKKGIEEQLRVLKPGGLGWLYVIEKPGGLFWDKIEILRAIMKNVQKEFAQKILKSMNMPDNRIFYMLDHVMVPINTRLSPAQVELELQKNGATSIRRLERGTDFDRIEKIHLKIPFAKEKFGVGENRYIFQKNP